MSIKFEFKHTFYYFLFNLHFTMKRGVILTFYTTCCNKICYMEKQIVMWRNFSTWQIDMWKHFSTWEKWRKSVHFEIYTVLLRFTRSCVEKNWAKNCASGEKRTNIMYGSITTPGAARWKILCFVVEIGSIGRL